MPAFNCPACGATFPTEAELKTHGAVHMPAAPTGASAFTCAACNVHFASAAELKAHGSRVHSR